VAKKARQEEIPFEEAISELESLVETMEKGELSLEESLASFERGVALTRICQQALKTAEQKIEILTANSAEAELESFRGD
jgi:exodeoxyribonuclease VII small subunit